jgi:hypothetical protein
LCTIYIVVQAAPMLWDCLPCSLRVELLCSAGEHFQRLAERATHLASGCLCLSEELIAELAARTPKRVRRARQRVRPPKANAQ